MSNGKLIPENQFDPAGKSLGDRRYVLEPSDAAKRGELSEGAKRLLQCSRKEVQEAFAKLADVSSLIR